jgi:hypothetical protein
MAGGLAYTLAAWGPDGSWYEGNTYASFVGLYAGMMYKPMFTRWSKNLMTDTLSTVGAGFVTTVAPYSQNLW